MLILLTQNPGVALSVIQTQPHLLAVPEVKTVYDAYIANMSKPSQAGAPRRNRLRRRARCSGERREKIRERLVAYLKTKASFVGFRYCSKKTFRRRRNFPRLSRRRAPATLVRPAGSANHPSVAAMNMSASAFASARASSLRAPASTSGPSSASPAETGESGMTAVFFGRRVGLGGRLEGRLRGGLVNYARATLERRSRGAGAPRHGCGGVSSRGDGVERVAGEPRGGFREAISVRSASSLLFVESATRSAAAFASACRYRRLGARRRRGASRGTRTRRPPRRWRLTRGRTRRRTPTTRRAPPAEKRRGKS